MLRAGAKCQKGNVFENVGKGPLDKCCTAAINKTQTPLETGGSVEAGEYMPSRGQEEGCSGCQRKEGCLRKVHGGCAKPLQSGHGCRQGDIAS